MPVRLVSQERLPPPLEGYILLERLGRGGFGEVWKAEAPGGLHKAIKFVFGDLESQEEENTRAAEQERKALDRVKAIRHPYILSLERYDVVDGQLIIVMELADRNLWDRFRECRGLGMPGIPREELLKYMEETAEALDLMNNHYHIQHLDVKPQNLFLTFNHVKVADFGLAKAFEGMRGTVTGGVTPVYAGPETFEGYVSRYTDQYSLAIVFQELLTGTRPFNGANTKQLLMQHLNGTPDLSTLPPGDQTVISRGLAKKPDQRWPSCTDLIKALRQAGSAVIAAPTGSVPQPGVSAMVTRVSRSDLRSPTPSPGGAANPTVPADSPTGVRSRLVRQLLPSYAQPGTAAPPVTPLPALVTPRMAGGGGSGLTPAVTLQRPVAVDTARAGTLGLAPPERNGPGVLMPALVVAVGRVGHLAVQKLKAAVRERFGGLDAVPHVRFLTIDTDPDAAADPADPAAAQHVVLARLNRPHHYLQPREGLPAIESWMPAGQLYRLPRNPGPAAGVRALGRLALTDNYRTVIQRIRQEVESFTSDAALDKAGERTGLGVRSNRARVYLVAGLAGGTGGGMFLDLAYILKNELRLIGYLQPDTVGVLLIPPADNSVPKNPGMANAYAALTELAHFQAGRGKYQFRFDPKEPPVTDTEGPFARTAVIQLPRRAEPKDMARSAGVVARGIFLDLFTPAGRTVDAVRAEADALNPDRVPVVSTFGLYRLTWPRSEMLGVAARRFARRLLDAWTSKETAHLRANIQGWLDDQWRARELELDAVVARFQSAARDSLREDPERVIDGLVDPLRVRGAGAGRTDAEAAVNVFDQLLRIVGKPDEEKDKPGALADVLAAKHRQMTSGCHKHLDVMSVFFVEQPQYRLAGAEETAALIEEKLKRTIDGLVGVREGLGKEVLEAYARLFALIGGLGAGTVRRGAVIAELVDTLRGYGRKRLRLLLLDHALTLYRGLLTGMPELVRELVVCRTRLSEIARVVGGGPGVAEGAGPGRMILPRGVEGLDGAADLFLAAFPPEENAAFDQIIQQEVQKKYKALVSVCVRPEHAQPFQDMLLAKSREFLDARLENADPAAAFFRYREEATAGVKMATRAFEAASPELAGVSGVRPVEASILGCPTGPDGDRFRAFAEQVLPEVQFIPAPLPDDIVFFREYPLLPLAELPQLGPHAREAYEAQLQSEHSPHARADVPWGTPGTN